MRAQLPRNDFLSKIPNKLHWSNFQKAGQKFLSIRKIVIIILTFQSILINSIVMKEKADLFVKVYVVINTWID